MGAKILKWVISWFGRMSFKRLYRLSDFLYIVVFKWIGYRKKVVLKNLYTAFPTKSQAEIHDIMATFYHNFIDMTLESIKGFTMPKEELLERYRFIENDFLKELKKNQQSVIAVGGHYTNWEWGVRISAQQIGDKKLVGIYKPIEDKKVEALTNSYRDEFGMNLVSTYETRKGFEKFVPLNSMFMMVADQNATNVEKSYWTTFFNKPTLTLHGPEYYARKYNLPIVFLDFQRVQRGYYTVEVSSLVEDVSVMPAGVPTQLFMSKLESVIRKKPEDWLWTHRRWKHDFSKYPEAKVVDVPEEFLPR